MPNLNGGPEQPPQPPPRGFEDYVLGFLIGIIAIFAVYLAFFAK